jgi:hypothetical protein
MQMMTQTQEEEDRKRKQEIEEGLKSGVLSFTPQQQQQRDRINAARAWISSNDIPEDVKRKELADIEEAERRLVPLRTPPEKMPVPPSEQIGRTAYVDAEGKYGRAGATWVLDPKTKKWDMSPNAPNNQLEYGKDNNEPKPGDQFGFEQNGGSDVPPNVNWDRPTYLANQMGPQQGVPTGSVPGGGEAAPGQAPGTTIGMGPAYGPRPASYTPGPNRTQMQGQGSVLEQQGEQRMWKSPTTGMLMTYGPKGQPEPVKDQFKMQELQWKEQKAKIDLEQKRLKMVSDQEAKRLEHFNKLVDAELKRRTKKDPMNPDATPELNARDYEQAQQWAMQQLYFQEKHFGIEAKERTGGYNNYLKSKFVGMTPAEVKAYANEYGGAEAQEAAQEIQRRESKNGIPLLPPEDWEKPESAPPPVAWIEKIRSIPPAQLEAFMEQVKDQRIATKKEFKKQHPGENYEQYKQFVEWAKSGGELPEKPERQMPTTAMPTPSGPSVQQQKPAELLPPPVEDPNRPGYFVHGQKASREAALDIARSLLPSPKTKAEFDKLKSGTEFVAPDGTVRRKP